MKAAQLVGERLLLARRRAGMDQKEVGALLGVTGATISRWEQGLRGPGWEEIYKLAKVYSVSIGFFFEGIEAADVDSPGKTPTSGRVLVGAY